MWKRGEKREKEGKRGENRGNEGGKGEKRGKEGKRGTVWIVTRDTRR